MTVSLVFSSIGSPASHRFPPASAPKCRSRNSLSTASMFWYRPSSAPSLNTRTWFTRDDGSPASRIIHMASRSRMGAPVS